jgi:hypothetical protein
MSYSFARRGFGQVYGPSHRWKVKPENSDCHPQFTGPPSYLAADGDDKFRKIDAMM